MTLTRADRVEDGQNGQPNFKLLETIRSTSGNVEGGRLTSTKKAYSVENFGKALENLDWD